MKTKSKASKSKSKAQSNAKYAAKATACTSCNMKTKLSLMVLAGLVLGFIHGVFWRFNTVMFVDNFYYDFILSWLIPLIVGVVILTHDKNDLKQKVMNWLVFWILASVMYFITTWLIFPVRFV